MMLETVCADVKKRRFFMPANQLPRSFMPSRASFLTTPWHSSFPSDEFFRKDTMFFAYLLVRAGRIFILMSLYQASAGGPP